MKMHTHCTVAVLLLLLQLASQATGHGVLLQPASRNWLAYLQGREYNSHGLNAGGTRKVSMNQTLKYPNGKFGFCGDAYDKKKWDVPGEIKATYIADQTIVVDFVIAVNHLGRIDMKLCDVNAKPYSKECRALQRADGKGTYWYLPFLSNWTGGNSGFVKPAYGDGTFTWYKFPAIGPDAGCSARECNQFQNMIVYRTKWKVPADFECHHCKLQWHYMTAHTCWPPCPAKNRGEPTCDNVQIYPQCGEGNVEYPEEFWNCADVRVVGPTSRVDTAANNQPVWEGKTDIKSGRFGRPRAYVMGEFQRRRLHRRSLLSQMSQWLGL